MFAMIMVLYVLLVGEMMPSKSLGETTLALKALGWCLADNLGRVHTLK